MATVLKPPPVLDLVREGLLAPLPAAMVEGRDTDLLAPLRLVADDLPPRRPAGVSRAALAPALERANASYGHRRSSELAAKLADPATEVVVTGQQPGLLGGPLLTLIKAIAAAKWAERLERAGRPAVAVFWVATEDHDFAEVSRAVVLAPDGPRAFDLGADPSPLLPVGMRTLGSRMTGLLDDIAAAVPGERYAAWLRELGRIYRPEARFGEAFCRLMARLLGDRCPLLLDAMLPEVKAGERPLLARLVERRAAIAEALAAAERRLTERGYRPQVEPRPEAGELFLLRGAERRRVEWRGPDGFALRGGDAADRRPDPSPPHPVAELEAAIAGNPGAVSPGVLARPAVQDGILGSSLFVVGPGELAYLAQAAALYPVLEVEPPGLALRPHALVLEAHLRERLADWGGSLADLLRPDNEIDRLLAGDDAGALLAPARQALAGALAGLGERALAVDRNLERPLQKTQEQIERALETFAGKLAAALARRDETRRGRLLRLREALLPLGEPQERVVSTAHFPGKHGEAFVERLWARLGLGARELQIVTLDGETAT
jgi:bacillithiol biosynthesis cysteine-adding enzyme BshC